MGGYACKANHKPRNELLMVILNRLHVGKLNMKKILLL